METASKSLGPPQTLLSTLVVVVVVAAEVAAACRGGGCSSSNISINNGRGLSGRSRGDNRDAEQLRHRSSSLQVLVKTGVLVSLNGVGQVGVVLQDLGVDVVEFLCGGDGGGVVLGGGHVGLHDGEATAEGAGEGIVAAADGADVTGGGASAGKVAGHGDGHVEVCLLVLGKTVGTGDVVGHGQVLDVGVGVAGHVDVANIWSGSVGVDLMHGDGELASLGNLGDLSAGDGVLGVLANIDVASEFSTTTLVDDVCLDLSFSDDGCVLLAGADAGAVAGKCSVDYSGCQ